MPPVESESQAARRQLERVLASPGFARNERLSRFLRFVVERHLEGRDQELKESLIAIEVFGRHPGFDSKQDPIVRTEASRLRSRLSEYYSGEGKGDSLAIELPKGGYVPVLVGQASRPVSTGREAGPTLLAVTILVLVALAVVGWWRFHQNAPIPIAVLPLNNLSDDPAHDYFADGLTGEIIRNLSIIEGLAVRSQTSSFAFKGKTQNVREAAKQLGADYILEGSVQRAEQQLRITAQLVRVSDDFPLWSGRYDREFTDIFAIQDEISRGIVNSLRLKLGRGRRRYETSTEAYDLYLRGRALQFQFGLRGYNRSIDPLEKAIAIDKSFAPAYAALAAAYALRSGQFHFDIPDEVQRMRRTAEEAIRLDPLSWEAYYALGIASCREAQWQEAERSFRRAIELSPGESLPHSNFAYLDLFPLGRVNEALQQLGIAEKLDPLSSIVHYQRAFVLMSTGGYREAEDHCNKMQEEFGGKDECLGWARLGQGRTDEVIQAAERRLDRRNRGAPLRAVLGCAYTRAGRRRDAEELAADSSFNPLNQAHILVCLGDKDRTFEALDRATAAGPFRIGRAIAAPEYAALRGDPRLRALRKKVGLPE